MVSGAEEHLITICQQGSYRLALLALSWREYVLESDAVFLSWCREEKKSAIRDRISAMTAEHAAGIAAFEKRWGDIPRFPNSGRIEIPGGF